MVKQKIKKLRGRSSPVPLFLYFDWHDKIKSPIQFRIDSNKSKMSSSGMLGVGEWGHSNRAAETHVIS